MKLSRLPFSLLSLVVLVACNDSGSSSSDDTTPPSLEIVSLETLEEVSLTKPGTITLGCDRILRLKLGPSESDDGELDHWDLRPPGDCSDEEQACGYVAVILKETSALKAKRSFDTVLLDSAITVPEDFEAASLTVRLTQGNSLSPYLVDDKAVEDSWALTFVSECTEGLGGAGGAAP